MDTWLDTASQWLTSLFATPTAPSLRLLPSETTSIEPDVVRFHLMPVAVSIV